MTIGWIEVHLKRQGGVIYNNQAREQLAQGGIQVELVDVSAKVFSWFRYLKIPEALFRLVFLRGAKDVWMRDFFSTLTMPLEKKQGKNAVLIHHIDTRYLPGLRFFTRPMMFAAEKLFYRNLWRADAIVVVSEYWKRHFIERGYSNVHVIYNGFDLPQFNILNQEVVQFKRKYGLDKKPIVYLGNCQKVKGVEEAYEALKGMDIHMVTSGTKEISLPARNFDLSYHEYLVLLKTSDIVLAMSKMQEGWNRTAHEAMLLGTPVIGSGLGGMRELLEGGNQIICEDFLTLREKVNYLLEHPSLRDTLGKTGYNYAKGFSLSRFQTAWINFIQTL